MKTKILITGGTGLVGQKLSRLLDSKGFEVYHLSRNPDTSADFRTFKWDIKNRAIDEAALDVDYVIHLAGASVADGRWTDKRKKLIYDSRIQSTRFLFDQFKSSKPKLKGFISASAIGYYGADTGDYKLTESSPPGDDFLAGVVKDWESAADHFTTIKVPVAKVRIGIVLAKEGGALPRLAQPVKYSAGAPIGPGNQFMSWIHIDDLCGIFLHIIAHKAYETFNAVAPKPVTNAELTKIVARTLNKPLILPNVPGFVMKMMFGEMAEILLGGNNVLSKRIEESGYDFSYKTAASAIKNLLG